MCNQLISTPNRFQYPKLGFKARLADTIQVRQLQHPVQVLAIGRNEAEIGLRASATLLKVASERVWRRIAPDLNDLEFFRRQNEKAEIEAFAKASQELKARCKSQNTSCTAH